MEEHSQEAPHRQALANADVEHWERTHDSDGSPLREPSSVSYLEATERAQRRLAGEVVAEPELPLRFAFEHTPTLTRILCPHCGSSELRLRGSQVREPDYVTIAIGCECGEGFRLVFTKTDQGVVVGVERDS
jgi:hypothetical protein